MYSVELFNRVRRACHVDGMSKSAAGRLFGIDRKTVAKILLHSVPPGYRRTALPVRPKGAWRDNVFIQRLWRSIKYEEVYLRAYASVSEARAGIGRYLTFYNSRRPHSSLDGRTPDQAYFNQPMPQAVAA